jgi:hypothetical protein
MFWPKKPKALPPPLPTPHDASEDEADVPRDPQYWIERLAKRAARLQRLVEIKAPKNIIEQEHRLIADAIAKLSPEDALAAIQRSKEIARHLDRSADPGPHPEADTVLN